jgi:hypothetical protein
VITADQIFVSLVESFEKIHRWDPCPFTSCPVAGLARQNKVPNSIYVTPLHLSCEDVWEEMIDLGKVRATRGDRNISETIKAAALLAC